MLDNNDIKIQRKDYIVSLGITLSIIGVSVGGLLKVLIGVNSSRISVAIVFLSTLLLLPGFSFKSIRRVTPIIFATLMYNLLILVLAAFSGIGWNVSGVGLTYQLFYFLQVLLVVGLSWNYDANKFINVAFWVFGLASVMALYIIFSKGFATNLTVLLERTEDANSVSRATTAYIGFLGLCIALIYKPNKIFMRFWRVLFIVAALMLEVLSRRRSTILALAIIFILVIRKREKRIFERSALIKIAISIASVLGLVILLYFTNNSVRLVVDKTWSSFVNGIKTYLGIDSSDMAASYRRVRLETIPEQYLNYSTLTQFLFGRGYNTDWLDIPFLQAFWDMGLFGGIYYLIVFGAIPLKHSLKPSSDFSVLFCQYYVILRVVQSFSNGTPYGSLLPFVLLYVFEKNAFQKNDYNVYDESELLDQHDQPVKDVIE